MAANYDWVKLETPQDYKFFACLVAEKLRNNNFKPVWREAFLKTLVEQIKPVCSYRAYERIEKLLNDIANQKHLEEKQEEEKLKKLSNHKDKNLKTLKAEKVTKNYAVDDGDSYSEDDEDDY